MNASRSVELLFRPFYDEMMKGFAHIKKESGIDCTIVETYRSPSRQDFLYAQGRTSPGKPVTRARGWESWHQYGVAMDIAILKNGRLSWDFKPEMIAKFLEGFNVTWGGINDGPHYQWKDLPKIVEAQKIAKGDGILAFWATLVK